jgi:cytochrome P450
LAGEVDYGFLATLVFGLIFAATSNNFATAAWLTFFTLSKPELVRTNHHYWSPVCNKSKILVFAQMKPLIEEQQEYLEMAKDSNADLSHALINKFNFTDMAVKETIRLCSGGLAMRRAMQDFVIDNKYVIPKGKSSTRVTFG